MAIQLKRSSVAGDVPAALAPGELAVNDGGDSPVLYIGTASGRVFALSGQWTEISSRLLDESGNVLTTEDSSRLRPEE
jgi:hypothetical protein